MRTRRASGGGAVRLALCGAGLLLGLAAAQASARTRTYAIVIAQNQSHDVGVQPLRYADDDGVKTWELLSLFADQASLFVVPDAETARLHPAAARRAEVPERAAICSSSTPATGTSTPAARDTSTCTTGASRAPISFAR
jgi:hypothetical protein